MSLKWLTWDYNDEENIENVLDNSVNKTIYK